MMVNQSVVFRALMLIGLTVASSARAEVARELEPDYAEAVLAYNSRDYNRALKILNELGKKAPQSVEFLELRAITLKANEQAAEAGDVYRELVRLKTKSANDKKEIAPYAFELGIIRFNEKKYQQADQYLNYAYRSGFNPEVSQLYLGLAGVQTKDWDKAERHFREVLKGQLEDLKPAAHFYLGQVYFQQQIPSSGFTELLTARKAAQKALDNPSSSADSRSMAEQIVKGVDTALSPFDKGQTFANFSFITGYDSNVLLVPNESDAAASGSTESTVKVTLSAGAGYATSPLNRYQLVPSFRFNANRNLNRDATAGEFSESAASLYVTRNALAPRAFGTRLEAAVIFQNEYDSVADSSKYRLYTSSFTLAPYMKQDLGTKWVLNTELGVRLVSFNGDDEVTESLRRNGPLYALRTGLQSKTNRRYFNPGILAKVEHASTEGTEFRSFAYGAALTNTLRVKEVILTQVLDLTRTTYGVSSTDRADTLFSVLLSGYRKIGPRWAVLGSADYTRNNSSEEASFSYSRYSINTGLSYSF